MIIFTSHQQTRDYLNWAHVRRLNWAILSLHRTNPAPFITKHSYLPDTEHAFHFWKGATFSTEVRLKRRHFVYQTGKHGIPHPTVKPLPVIEALIEHATPRGQCVLDPFMGSGTTGVACKKLARRFIGIEKNASYFSLAKKRINEGR